MRPAPDGQGAARRYHLLELTGRGAYGDVYLAELDSGGEFRRKVALKVLNDDTARHAVARHRIRQEARILGRIAHRHIVTALDFVRFDDRWAIVMDHVPGADLEHLLAALESTGQQFPGPAAFEVGAAIADALHAAWSAGDDDGEPLGIIHRDIKPSNVRLTPDGEVKVLDFGVARSPDEPEAGGTTSLVGTELYMAPERVVGTADLPVGDVYSTAATVIELLLGRPLGKTPVTPSEHAALVEEALTEARLRLVGAPDQVDRAIGLLRASVSARPEERPSAAELAEGCEAVARGLQGEGLRAFSRRFVPSVDGLLGRVRVPIDELWLEDALPNELANPSFGHPRGGTIIPDELASDEPVPEVLSSRWRRRIGGLVLTAMLSMLCGGTTVVAVVSAFGPGAAPPVAPVAAKLPALLTDPVLPPPSAPAGPVDPFDADPVVAAAMAEAPVEPAPAARIEAAPPEPAAAQVAPARSAQVAKAQVAKAQVAKAQLTLPDASRIDVRCGSARFTGTSSVRMTSFPAGPCTVSAEFLGRALETRVTIERVGQVGCAVIGEELSCSLR